MKLNKTLPYAEISPPWRGASFKQGGQYFDALGAHVDVGSAADGILQVDAPLPIRQVGLEPALSKDGLSLTWGMHRWVREDMMQRSVDGMRHELATLRAKIAEEIGDRALDRKPPEDVPPNPNTEAHEPVLSDIPGITTPEIEALDKYGIRSVLDMASLNADAIAGLKQAGAKVEAEWVNAAVQLLAAAHPEAVSIQPAEPAPESGLTRADVIAWAKGQKVINPATGAPPHWQVMRKAMREHFATNAANEVQAIAALIRDKVISEDEARR